ncbi:hypothetical protein EKO04_009803 [Ascochyta lentis]|uniref:Cytochrome P450 n=1 Tax=Ascochyta lentis TaxID=205686 RepID=A0A8H7IVQ2_9PLEO|nr:hypothetical protein EKO04_009803 [Ascochyta lentis]
MLSVSKAEGDSLFTTSGIAVVILTYWIVATIWNFARAPKPPTSIPWVGYGKGWIAGLRNFLSLTKGRHWLLEGYDIYSKHDKIFVLPATLGMQAEVVLPRSQMRWMFDQPDNVLSTSEAHYDLLMGDYSFVSPVILKDPYHEHVIHKNLVRNLNAIIPEIEDEVPFAVAEVYGTDTEKWKELESLQSFMKMIPVLINRMLVGKSLCRERKFLDAVLGFTTDVIRTQSLMHLIPSAFHLVVGTLLGLSSTYHYWQSAKHTLPLIEQRISNIERRDSGDPELKDWSVPNDFITWSYRTAQAEGRHDEARPRRIAQRILPLNFASIHTTSLTAYETITNILSAGPSVIQGLREEAYRVLQEDARWTKQSLARMHRMDSAIRESQRVSPIALTFSHRKVVAKEGIVTPEGVHVEYGSIVSCPWTALALDHDITEEPNEFDAFRYSRPREAYEAMSVEEKATVDALELKQTGLVTTGLHHLPFGHGRHACPGRFFVSHELKMIFAYLLLNYDFKLLAERAQKIWIVRYQVPLPAPIQVRRRKDAWTPEVKN